MPNGIRRAHTRNGKPVRSASIKGRKAPRKRLNAGARRRAQSKPLLLAAGTLAGLGALDAILTGRWGGALVLGFGALCFGVGHLAWSHHKNRQATRPAKPAKPQQSGWQAPSIANAHYSGHRTRCDCPKCRQRREALEKARAAQPSLEQDLAAARARDAERNEPLAKRRRYDEMQSMLARQRKRGQPEGVWPGQYEEFFDGPGQVKPRPSGRPEPAAPKASNGAPDATEPTSHAEWQTRYGRRCDCTNCRAKRRAEKAEKVSLR